MINYIQNKLFFTKKHKKDYIPFLNSLKDDSLHYKESKLLRPSIMNELHAAASLLIPT